MLIDAMLVHAPYPREKRSPTRYYYRLSRTLYNLGIDLSVDACMGHATCVLDFQGALVICICLIVLISYCHAEACLMWVRSFEEKIMNKYIINRSI